MRRFYSPPNNFADGRVMLDEGETRHLRDVLRLQVGDTVNVFDGAGNEFESKIEKIEKRSSSLSVLRKTEPPAPESNLDLTLCAAILKSDKTDVAVQKAVELGVNRFVPMLTARCDVKPKDAVKRVERWHKIALEASKQCGRARLMEIGEVSIFENVIRKSTTNLKTNQTIFFFSERDGGKFEPVTKLKSITAFLGPEGGWDDSEIDLARELRAEVITLKGRIMKADTAAIAISAILQHHFGDLN